MATFQQRINQFRQGLDTQQQHFNDAMGQASQYGQRILEDKFGQHYENIEKTGGAVLTAGLTTGATIKGLREIAHNYKAKKQQLAEARSKNSPTTATEQQGGGKQSDPARPADDDVNRSAPVLQEGEGREGGGRAETRDEAPGEEAGVLGREALEGEEGEEDEAGPAPAPAPRQAPAQAEQTEPVRGELSAGRGDLDFSLGGGGGGSATADDLFSNLPARPQKPAKPDAEPAPPEQDEDENTYGFPGNKYVEPEGGQLAPQANQPKGKQPAGQPDPAGADRPKTEGQSFLEDAVADKPALPEGGNITNVARVDDATQAVARGGEALDTLKSVGANLGEGSAGLVGQALSQVRSTAGKVAGGVIQGGAGVAQGGRAVGNVVSKVRGTTAGDIQAPSTELADQTGANLADQAVASAKSWVGRQVSSATDAISNAGRNLGTSMGIEGGSMDAISAVGGAMMEAVPILGDIAGAGMLIYGVVKEIEDAKKHSDDPTQYSAQTAEPTEQAGGIDPTALGGSKSTGGAGIV